MIDSLYQYNDWANAKLFALASGLSDQQLDSPREMGLGTLRATLFHMFIAEKIWLERWQQQPWRAFQTDPNGISLKDLEQEFAQVSSERRALIEQYRHGGWEERIGYLDSKKNEYSNRLIDMLLHVANHAVHHRAQGLHFLKQFDRKVAGGLDYIFFRIAFPSTPLISEYVAPMKQFGMEVDSGRGEKIQFLPQLLQDFYAYHDWATAQLLPAISKLDSEAQHRDFQMGPGSIHKTISHLRSAERWWLGLWNESKEPFPKYDPCESIESLTESWQSIASQRNALVRDLDEVSCQRVVIANPANLQVPLRVIESMVQLCCHGTHHRAQIINMLRQSGVAAPGVDFIVWKRLQS